MEDLYPMTFKPILKKMIWGGNALCPFKGITPVEEGVGESWEISDVKDNCSIIDNGFLNGKSIDEVIKTYGASLLGKSTMERTGETFPLLIKFIDAHDNLSIQVHPNDQLAWQRHHSFGKTEMWYVIKAAPGAALYSGFSKQIDPEEYVQRVADNSFMEVLQRYEVHAGDAFFLPAGRVHAIGAGCFIAEIQQTSNITYRIYDYNRRDANGKGRELHTELAKDAIDYTIYKDYRSHYTPQKNASVELAGCKYFTTNLLDLDKGEARFHALKKCTDSFVIYLCLEGYVQMRDENVLHDPIMLHQGQTLLFPATTQEVFMAPLPACKLLEVYIPKV
ncbi:MAG: class I mannose-6-phosphate isomerase [Tannerella sp.]|jgi:mannose-6-phosphate isomerase|nr:class I mannose-6-phosphate isomerase [Tannerella sp.]